MFEVERSPAILGGSEGFERRAFKQWHRRRIVEMLKREAQSGFQERHEAGLIEVMIGGEGVADVQFAQDDKTDTVRE